MDLHNRYLHSSTVSIAFLHMMNKCKIDVNELLQCYNNEMTTEELNIEKLEFYRLLLCYEYQIAFSNIDCKKYVIPADTKKICFPSIKMIFPPNYSRNVLQISLLCDIIILQMILYHNTTSVKQRIQDFLYLSNIYIMNSDSRIMYMKVIEYFLEFLHLYKLHVTCKEMKELEDLNYMYLEIIKSWIKMKKDNEWRLFALILPKLVKTFTSKCIIFPLWNYFLYEMNDLKESLTVLSIMADTSFTSSDSTNYLHGDIYSKNTFWLFILKGLRSTVQQYRKQAVYIMKKANDSMSKEIILHLIKSDLTKAQITPFICSQSDTILMNDIKERFFLVQEVLEEKQEHLIMPALIHIADLVKINKEHRACNCFNIVWLQCIFEKILLHEDNRIAKWGISYVCKLDVTIFEDSFLDLFIKVLNNNFLYECQSDEEYPDIVKELSQFLKCAKKTDLLNRFLKKINHVAWGPVAIFYIIHTLRTISQEGIQHSNWQATELNAVKSLVKTNLSIHSHILRTASQIELLRAIPNYVQQINDLSLLANVLATFPTGEGLTRGTAPWNVITTWLQNVLAKNDVKIFVEQVCAKYMSENANSDKINPTTFAMIIYLLHDANLIFSYKSCPVSALLNNWLYTLNGITTRPYVDIASSIHIIEFVSHLLHLSVQGSLNNITNFILLHINTTFNFLIKYMKKMSAELTYENYMKYIAIVSSHIVNASFLMQKRDVNVYVERLRRESMNLIDNSPNLNLQYLYGLHVFYLSQNAMALPETFTETFYTNHLSTMRMSMNIHEDINTTNLRGKITSEYYLLLLKLMHQYILHSPVSSWVPTATLLVDLLQFLEIGLPENIPKIAEILTVIVDNKVINDTSDRKNLECAFNLGFTCIINCNKNNIFWTAVENLMEVIINNNFLSLSNAIQFAEEYIIKLLNEGENIPRFKRIIISKMKNLDIYNLIKLETVLGNCLLHGSVYRRDKKIENYAHLFINKHLGQYYPKHIFTIDYNNDVAIRAEAIILLHKIIQLESNYAVNFVQQMLNALEKNKTKRYFNDSSLHKLKHRTMQVLLILEPALNEESVLLLQEKLCDFIFLESNQSSVKIMQEWLMIRIFTKHIHLHDKLWSFFIKSIKHRPRCTISVASIVYHVAKLLPNSNQKAFIHTALPYITQCCLGQQFNVRFYNQFILTQLYELIKATYGEDSISDYKGIYQAAMIGLQQENPTKTSFKIQDDFYFSTFHPINDYSLQTIYYELPRLANVSCDEWISPDVFKDLMFKQSDNHSLQLYNVNSSLIKTKSSAYLTKFFAGDIHAKPLEDDAAMYMNLCDIQKKIDTFKPVDLHGDNLEIMNEFVLQDTQLQKGLIVVASFLDRPPNLGGIARTCEIFGVNALVVANANCVKDKEFQFLSVSADKWLNILQVKPCELQKFLLDRKNAGWSLIGVEQTVNSINLITTQFHEKTVLVLGNEKDGIPPNFIPIFDKCVEIPQVGVTRSLNVHVTAAICIWQYASQHILK